MNANSQPTAAKPTAATPVIETIDRRSISEADARAIAQLIVSIWPKPDRTVDSFTADMLAQWKNYDGPDKQRPRSFLIRQDGQVVAHSSV